MAVKIEKSGKGKPPAAPKKDDTPFPESVPKTQSPVKGKKGKGKAPVVELKQPVATVHVKHPSGAETEKQENALDPVLVSEPMANVGMTLGTTRNLGDYNNVKYSVSLFLPTATDEASVNAAFKRVKKWVSKRMDQLAAELEAGD